MFPQPPSFQFYFYFNFLNSSGDTSLHITMSFLSVIVPFTYMTNSPQRPLFPPAAETTSPTNSGCRGSMIVPRSATSPVRTSAAVEAHHLCRIRTRAGPHKNPRPLSHIPVSCNPEHLLDCLKTARITDAPQRNVGWCNN